MTEWVHRDTKVKEHFEQSTVVRTDICKYFLLVLQKKSLENRNQMGKKGHKEP